MNGRANHYAHHHAYHIASSAVVEATVNYLNVCLIDLPEPEPMSSAPTGTVAECPDDFDFWVQLLQAEMDVTPGLIQTQSSLSYPP